MLSSLGHDKTSKLWKTQFQRPMSHGHSASEVARIDVDNHRPGDFGNFAMRHLHSERNQPPAWVTRGPRQGVDTGTFWLTQARAASSGTAGPLESSGKGKLLKPPVTGEVKFLSRRGRENFGGGPRLCPEAMWKEVPEAIPVLRTKTQGLSGQRLPGAAGPCVPTPAPHKPKQRHPKISLTHRGSRALGEHARWRAWV